MVELQELVSKYDGGRQADKVLIIEAIQPICETWWSLSQEVFLLH